MPVGLRGSPEDCDKDIQVGVKVLKSNASKLSCHKVDFFNQMGFGYDCWKVLLFIWSQSLQIAKRKKVPQV